ncbi:MAG TPA: nitroreductase family protein [Phycisphaerae bacterium]|nr:nitroreductase family protein [Phycisphaerae bacterium]
MDHRIDRRTFLKTVPAVTLLAAEASALAQEAGEKPPSMQPAAARPEPVGDLQPIILPKPQTDGGKSVLAALQERKTIRSISDKKLAAQELSNLLWAAFGVNREHGPSGRLGRTAASASNSQEIDLYVVMPEGIYLYEAVPHRLVPVAAGDKRENVGGHGRRGSAIKAPVSIVFVVDIARYSQAPFQEPGLKDPEVQKSYYNVATGLIAGNIYLFAASQGLAAWFHNCNKTALAEQLKLRPDQRVLYAQTVGYPE